MARCLRRTTYCLQTVGRREKRSLQYVPFTALVDVLQGLQLHRFIGEVYTASPWEKLVHHVRIRHWVPQISAVIAVDQPVRTCAVQRVRPEIRTFHEDGSDLPYLWRISLMSSDVF